MLKTPDPQGRLQAQRQARQAPAPTEAVYLYMTQFPTDPANFLPVDQVTEALRTIEAEEGPHQSQAHIGLQEISFPPVAQNVRAQPETEASAQSQAEPPQVELQASPGVQTQKGVSVTLANKQKFTKSNQLTECISCSKHPLKPSPAFSITGLDTRKSYQVSLSFKQGKNLRKYGSGKLKEDPPKPFTEPNVVHRLLIASGKKFMKGDILFRGIKVTNKVQDAGGQVIHLNSCHKYTPVLIIKEFGTIATPLKFSFEEGSFRATTNKPYVDRKRRREEKAKLNPKKPLDQSQVPGRASQNPDHVQLPPIHHQLPIPYQPNIQVAAQPPPHHQWAAHVPAQPRFGAQPNQWAAPQLYGPQFPVQANNFAQVQNRAQFVQLPNYMMHPPPVHPQQFHYPSLPPNPQMFQQYAPPGYNPQVPRPYNPYQ